MQVSTQWNNELSTLLHIYRKLFFFNAELRLLIILEALYLQICTVSAAY